MVETWGRGCSTRTGGQHGATHNEVGEREHTLELGKSFKSISPEIYFLQISHLLNFE